MTKISPSILAADFADLGKSVELLEKSGADYIHCDVMDGVYVPSITFGAQTISAIRTKTKLPLDVHLMIVEPHLKYMDFIDAGADIITFHPDACYHPHYLLTQIKKSGIKCGVVLNPGVPVSRMENLLDLCDIVLLMSVNPGWGGQSFIHSTLKKATELVKARDRLSLNFEIEIDGGINNETGAQAVSAGVDVLVAGSFVFRNENFSEAIDSLKKG